LTNDGLKRLRGRLDVGRWLNSIGVTHWEVPSSDGTRKYFFDNGCLFDPTHTGKDACIISRADGGVAYKCFHNSCADRKMRDVYELHGEPSASFYDDSAPVQQSSTPARRESKGQWRSQPEAPTWSPAPQKFSDFVAKEFTWDWIIPDVLLAGQNFMFAGPEKCLKTTICIELMLSVASGEPFLGTFPVAKPGPVMFISGESGEPVLWETTRRIAKAKGIDFGRDLPLRYEFSLPIISEPSHVDMLRELIEKHSLSMVIVDPAYLSLLPIGSSVNTGDNLAMGPLLKRYGELSQGTNCVMGLIHHATKALSDYGDDIKLTDMAGAGFREYARQWLLLRRREAFIDAAAPHRIAMQIGGAAGQNSKWAIEAIEWDGTYLDNGQKSPRIWQCDLKPWHEAEAEAEAEKMKSEEELDADIRQQLIAHAQLALGKISRNSLAKKINKKRQRVFDQIDSLVHEQIFEEILITRGDRVDRYYSMRATT
jgi:hypothetical protein